MVILNLLVFAAMAAMTALLLTKPDNEDLEHPDYLREDLPMNMTYEKIDRVILAAICGFCGLLFLIVGLFGCCTVCCRICCCGFGWSALSLIFGVALLGLSVMLTYILEGSWQCEASADVKAYYGEFVDKTMCSDICPCNEDAYYAGQWDTLTEEELYEYDRGSLVTHSEIQTVNSMSQDDRDALT